jgi:uncharacterized protein
MGQDTRARSNDQSDPPGSLRAAGSTHADLELDSRLLEAARRLSAATKAVAVVLFGSRARGTGHQWSDWDLCVVLPDDAPASELTPFRLRPLTSDLGIPIDVVTMRLGIFQSSRSKPETLSYEIARDGRLLYGQVEMTP